MRQSYISVCMFMCTSIYICNTGHAERGSALIGAAAGGHLDVVRVLAKKGIAVECFVSVGTRVNAYELLLTFERIVCER